MDFELVGSITEVQPIAVGRAIRGLARLRKRYGSGRWRKLKGIARVRLPEVMRRVTDRAAAPERKISYIVNTHGWHVM